MFNTLIRNLFAKRSKHLQSYNCKPEWCSLQVSVACVCGLYSVRKHVYNILDNPTGCFRVMVLVSEVVVASVLWWSPHLFRGSAEVHAPAKLPPKKISKILPQCTHHHASASF